MAILLKEICLEKNHYSPPASKTSVWTTYGYCQINKSKQMNTHAHTGTGTATGTVTGTGTATHTSQKPHILIEIYADVSFIQTLIFIQYFPLWFEDFHSWKFTLNIKSHIQYTECSQYFIWMENFNKKNISLIVKSKRKIWSVLMIMMSRLFWIYICFEIRHKCDPHCRLSLLDWGEYPIARCTYSN